MKPDFARIQFITGLRFAHPILLKIENTVRRCRLKPMTSPEKPVLDIDFENFSVAKERAEEIRTLTQQIKTEAWLSDFKTLVNTRGEEQVFTESGNLTLPGLLTDTPSRVFRKILEIDSETAEISITLQGSELKVFLDSQIQFEFLLLPKDDEFALMFAEPNPKMSHLKWIPLIKEDIKQAKAEKAERARAFKQKFLKAEQL